MCERGQTAGKSDNRTWGKMRFILRNEARRVDLEKFVGAHETFRRSEGALTVQRACTACHLMHRDIISFP